MPYRVLHTSSNDLELNTPSVNLNRYAYNEATNSDMPASKMAHWYGTKSPVYFYAYSAYYDDRWTMGSPTVVVLALLIEDKMSWKKNNFTCHFLDSNGYITDTSQTATSFISMYAPNDLYSENEGKFVSTGIVRCSITTKKVPTLVTLTMNPHNVSLCTVPVSLPSKPKVKKDIGACVNMLYNVDTCSYCKPMNYSKHLIPWMELQRMVGVDQITMYNHTMTEETSRILKYYVNKGFVKLYPQGPFAGNVYRLPGAISINDCMYRNMYSFVKLLIIDLDEYIIPRYNLTLMEAIKSFSAIMKKEFFGAEFLFKNTVFYTDYKKFDLSKPRNIQVLRHRYHAPPEPFNGGAKSLIDPMTCIYAHMHFCHSFSYFNRQIKLNESFGLSHHYKDCSSSWWRFRSCKSLFVNMTRDNIMLRYEHKLKQMVSEVQNTLYGKPSV